MSFERQVRERIESVLRGKKKPKEIPGATSIRCALGLVLGKLEDVTTLDEGSAWNYLDPGNVLLVHKLRDEYSHRVEKWRRGA